MTVFLFTPILPQRTGTADYANLLARELSSKGSRDDFAFVTDGDLHPERLPATVCGIRVMDHRQLPSVALPGDTQVYFVANNHYHSFVFSRLSDLSAKHAGSVVAIVHDPGCAFIANSLALNGLAGFCPVDLIELNQVQYGRRSSWLYEQIRASQMPAIEKYISHCQTFIIEKANEIWVHSKFAFLKLVLESHHPLDRFPTFKLVQHPMYDYRNVRRANEPSRRSDQFTVGIFGWIQESKRVKQAIAGFSDFQERSEKKGASNAKLMIVGEQDANAYDIRPTIAASSAKESIEFVGFVDEEEFKRRIGSVDLVLNLRFPSCGETSGVYNHARQAGVPIATTDYQAFHEAPSDYKVRFAEAYEVGDISEAISAEFGNWSRGETQQLTVHRPLRRELGFSVADCLLARAALDRKQGQGAGSWA